MTGADGDWRRAEMACQVSLMEATRVVRVWAAGAELLSDGCRQGEPDETSEQCCV